MVIKLPTYKIGAFSSINKATKVAKSAFDPAVRMALTQKGGQKDLLETTVSFRLPF
jgi:hypothetical protein